MCSFPAREQQVFDRRLNSVRLGVSPSISALRFGSFSGPNPGSYKIRRDDLFLGPSFEVVFSLFASALDTLPVASNSQPTLISTFTFLQPIEMHCLQNFVILSLLFGTLNLALARPIEVPLTPRENGIAQGIADSSSLDGVVKDTTNLNIDAVSDSIEGIVPKLVEGLGLAGRDVTTLDDVLHVVAGSMSSAGPASSGPGIENVPSPNLSPVSRSIGLENVVQAIGSNGVGGNINNINAAKSDFVSDIIRHASHEGLDLTSAISKAGLSRRGNGILQAITGTAGVDPISGDPVEQSTGTLVNGSLPKSAVSSLVNDLVSLEGLREPSAMKRQILNHSTDSIGLADQGASGSVAALPLGAPPQIIPAAGPIDLSFPLNFIPPATDAVDDVNTHADAGLLQIVTSGAGSGLTSIPILSN
ncbi:hypothetical protein CVT24_011505 [Panaeolus cyanescens]|uniref:Uncharacterized protein n=1 Tax=Panaeolus cyanescens TaxID=181874 RepID=A0A409VGN1_9AGAR|nr:hypothetical protein CVT24_011505 [Panaeolus cyanescens]